MKSAVAACKSLTFVLVSGISLVVGNAPVAFAADEGIEEVVVTARYREEKLQDTPLAITAITSQDIEAKSFAASYEIAYSVPNASFRPAQAAFGNTMTAFIRGIGQNDFDFAFEPGVGMYVDDVYNPFTLGSQIDLLDLERVEVLRGPQGTLFGRGSIGGAVRYVSKKPTGDNSGFINATTGEFDRVDVRAGFDFSIIPDTLMARITGVSKQRDGYQRVEDFACSHPSQAGTFPVRILNRGKGCQIGTQGGEDVTGARASVRWVINDKAEANFTAEYQNDASEARADTLIQVAPLSGAFAGWDAGYVFPTYGIHFDNRFVPNTPYLSYATYDDFATGKAFKPESTIEKNTYSGKLDWQITPQILATAILAHMQATSQFATDADQSPLNEQLVDGHETLRTDTAEVRFTGRAWDRMDWTVGAFFYDGRAVNTQTVMIPPFLFCGAFCPPFLPSRNGFLFDGVLVNAHNAHDAENQSGYGHMVFDLTDKWRLTGGVRYSHDAKDVDFDNTIVQSTINLDDNHFDWKVGLDYKFTDDIMGYGSVSTGYRPQSYNPRPFQVTQAVAVDGEEQTAYELGFKADLFDRKVRLNAAGFYSDYSKRITPVGGIECLVDASGNYITVPAGTPGAITDSLGNICLNVTSRTFYQNTPAKIYGAEVEAEWRPIEPLTLNGTFGWTHWHSSDINTAAGAVSNNASYVPTTNWSVAASYEVNMANGSKLTPRVDVYGQSEICFSPFSQISCAAGYELVNLRVEWTSPEGAWTAAAGATNIADKEYFLNTFDLSLFGQPTTEGQPGHPREWFFTVGRKF